MAGPADAKTAFVRNNILTVVDGRGHIWHYDPAIKVDAAGGDIVAPAGFARAEVGDGAIMVIDPAGAVWLFNLTTGLWSKGPQADDNLPGEAEKTTDPWKRGHNVHTPAVEPEEVATEKKQGCIEEASMAVTSIAKPGDFQTTFTLTNTTTPDTLPYGITRDGKIYRGRIRADAAGTGGRGTWVDTGLTIPDVSTVADL